MERNLFIQDPDSGKRWSEVIGNLSGGRASAQVREDPTEDRHPD